MLSLRLVVMSAILVFATACGGGYSSPSTAPSPSPTPSPTPTSSGPSSSVAISVGASSLRNTAYSPDELNVAAGTTVIWTNTDSVSHTSTSDATGWDSGIVAPGGKFSVAFQTPGRFSYHCAIHPGMIGTVVVN
jgi:plastocyanin